ncbi:methionine--tRNA ligase [Erysipelothrix urinaevulpis]|uniref:methionine--tRNA ligase n=1 Tax=Erysipelothrix urinaevulpis TaxID=2683717 RepID=UPI00135CACCE|nr:methionine--tRNA ligase [Erysipelothrix urinaevulpis]
MEKEKYYITTAIAYTSAKPHIGNIYEIVLTDAIARFKRAQGYDVYFQTGTDEHGQKIEDYASKNNTQPKEYVDNIAGIIRGLFDLMNVSYDGFVRTTDVSHKEEVQKIFKKLFEQDDLYKGFYEGWYCKACESFYSDTQVTEEGICPECGAKITRQKEETYFFRMSKYQERLVKHIEENPNFIQPESRKNEMVQNFLKEPLYDLAVSRTSFKWGIPVDFDPEHVIYVWIDALTNYITGLGYDVDGNHAETFNHYWPADVHVIGKDILRFHTIYWPILLMALDVELPKQIFGHPWLLVGDGKMSKSKGNVLYVDDLAAVFGVDPVRYLMLHEMPYDRDGTLSYELMIERINTDLANITGNLVNRTISMVNKYFDGTITHNSSGADIDTELLTMTETLVSKVENKMKTLHVAQALDEVIKLFRRCNKYIDETEPWALAKNEDDAERLQTVLYNLLDAIRVGAIVLQSFIPETAEKILNQINVEDRQLDDAKGARSYPLNNKVVEKPDIIFHRLDVKETLEKFEPEEEIVGIEEVNEVNFEEFKKIEMVVAQVKKVEAHPNADKLYVLQLDAGNQDVQVVSGLVAHYSPEELLNKKVVLVKNLKPVKLRGVLSSGMVLAANDKENFELLFVDKIKNGTLIS